MSIIVLGLVSVLSAVGGGVGTYFFLRNSPKTAVKIEQAVDSAVSKISGK